MRLLSGPAAPAVAHSARRNCQQSICGSYPCGQPALALPQPRRAAVAAGGGCGSTQPLAAAVGDASEAFADQNGRGNSTNGAAARLAGRTGGKQRQRQRGATPRPPCLPPLPYWCEAVAVVGLPRDELVFCFQNPTQVTAVARRELRPEARYGGQAVKLASLRGDRLQATLDRWQYACAQQELARLDCSQKLWWQYDSAVKGLANDARRDREAAKAAQQAAEQEAREQGWAAGEVVGNRRQRRRAARAKKAGRLRKLRPAQHEGSQAEAAASSELGQDRNQSLIGKEQGQQQDVPPDPQPAVAAQRRRQPWVASVAALPALLPSASQLMRSLLGLALRCCLTAYRALAPFWLRRLFWRSWPPRVKEAHASPALAALLARPAGQDAAELAAAGFNSQGVTEAPLADLPRWRIEALTRQPARDLWLYRTALTHKSALPLELRREKSYDRLEFLGDSVLGLASRSALMVARPYADEGGLTRLNSRLVSGASNARYASWLGLERYLLLDPKGLREGGQHKPAILADAFEALLGALYLDRGFEAARRFCGSVLEACVEWEELEGVRDYKALLCRHALMNHVPQPRFQVRSSSQREYKAGLLLPWWRVDVSVRGEVMGTGGSFDKRDAEQAAARQALERLGEL